jgi:ABC-type branched-subunit amino acid transport system ATPase component/ABC-type branched-subunit amino acid transport system permease subunit
MVLLVWPVVPGIPFDMVSSAILACEYVVAALSLVLLIGLVGQISLCQAAFVGMGAFVGALATHRLGVQFPFTLLVGTAAGTLSALAIGTVALRVRGLYLAVATLIFAYVCDQYLFVQPWLVDSPSGTSIPSEAIGRPGAIPYFDLSDAHVFYYVALAVAAATLYTVANLRDSKLGRAFSAIRGSEVAAASLGVNVVRTKLLAFACAGALAGLGGAVTLVGDRAVGPSQFDFTNSLYFLAIAVVGGLRSLGGAVSSSVLFALLVGEVFYRSPKLADYRDVISAGLLISVLLFFRGGLGAVPHQLGVLRSRLAAPLRRLSAQSARRPEDDQGRRPAPLVPAFAAVGRGLARPVRSVGALLTLQRRVPGGTATAPAASIPSATSPIDVIGLVERLAPANPAPAPVTVLPVNRAETEARDAASVHSLLEAAIRDAAVAGTAAPDGRRQPVLLSAEHITVQFGGLTAVDDVSLRVGAGEIIGLIGPNGAGKTTLFNSILGLNTPTRGQVELFGHDVTKWQVHQRAALGVGRTFQILQLFGDLSVFDNLLVATHLQNGTGLWGSLVVSPGAQRAERAARARVRAVLRLMELEHLADRRVAGLPFGVLRLIEVARTLVTGARLVCFDEPASGLDSAETERLIEWFRLIRQIGITLLVIEHDVSMVVRLCDYIYVLDQGRLLASGPPAQIQRDPEVIASYLGTAVEVA